MYINSFKEHLAYTEVRDREVNALTGSANKNEIQNK